MPPAPKTTATAVRFQNVSETIINGRSPMQVFELSAEDAARFRESAVFRAKRVIELRADEQPRAPSAPQYPDITRATENNAIRMVKDEEDEDLLAYWLSLEEKMPTKRTNVIETIMAQGRKILERREKVEASKGK